MDRHPIHCTIDLLASGKRHGHLCIPYSYNLGGWANLLVPITVVAEGTGPTVLVMAGNHGDEYPGQIAILKLVRELEPSRVKGRVILIPVLNMPASKAGTRLSPLDGKNLNRCFPGRLDGTPTELLAHYLATVVFPLADVVIDIHTGGRSVDFYPCAHMHLVDNPAQCKAMMAATLAWNTDFAFLYADIAGSGLLPVEAERQGKVVVTTEMGGGEPVPLAVHRLTQQGLTNVLVHLQVLQGEFATRNSLSLPPTRWVQALSRDDYRFAPESGIYENLAALGAEVAAGEPVGQIHFVECPQREPIAVVAPSAGVLLACRGPALVSQGDCVACIAHDVPREVLDV